MDETAPGTPGSASINPDRGRIGEWGTWTVRFVAGADGLRRGGAIQVELPERWHQWWRNSARRVQATDPAAPCFVSAGAGQPGVRVRCEVQEQAPVEDAGAEPELLKQPRIAIDGRSRRYAWVVRATVEEGDLAPGGTIDVRYGDRSGGSRGFPGPLWGETPEQVRLAVDATGGGAFVPLPAESRPWLHSEPGPPAELALVLPSSTVVGEPAEAIVVALDANLNPTRAPGLRVEVRVVKGEADLTPGAAREEREGGAGTAVIALESEDALSVRVPFIPRAAGTLRLRGQSADGRLGAVSNPSRCNAEAPPERLYWGDLHGHSTFSHDGTGASEDAFRYARDVSGLEVYGNADHGESLRPEDWDAIVANNARYYQPGRFVTLVGYENSQRHPYGHHNVFYRGASGALLHSRDAPLGAFWEQATPGEVLTIPHHTIALGRPGSPNVDWSIADDRFRRVAEIYSGHGQSELTADDHPLASDVVDFTFTGPAGPNSAVRDGWMTGQRMGTIASSDNHCARPGREGFGVLAVYAPALTREAVFDAIHRRRTYGTTGSRIVLDFTLNGTPMGGEARLEGGQPVRLQGHILGTGPLRFVEVLRGDLDGQEWRVAHREWFSGMGAPRALELDWSDPAPPARGLYYLRVRQRDLVHGRVAMAWSSPVWVDLERAT
ncbi:MAG TPA: DUF3604 domain-containing protein [Chloroflexota bacterium]|nr:DUF3604 domain-containing protein [Chloroflexota bacterium]